MNVENTNRKKISLKPVIITLGITAIVGTYHGIKESQGMSDGITEKIELEQIIGLSASYGVGATHGINMCKEDNNRFLPPKGSGAFYVAFPTALIYTGATAGTYTTFRTLGNTIGKLF